MTELYARLAYPAELAANGALLGLMYALVALGIVLVYKSSAVANLAHGSLVMLGAFVTWAITTHLRFPLGWPWRRPSSSWPPSAPGSSGSRSAAWSASRSS